MRDRYDSGGGEGRGRGRLGGGEGGRGTGGEEGRRESRLGGDRRCVSVPPQVVIALSGGEIVYFEMDQVTSMSVWCGS